MDNMLTTNSRKYSFDSLKVYVEAVFKTYLEAVEAGTEEERKKEQERKEVLRRSLSSCFAGGVKERDFVKRFILRVITGQREVFVEGYGEDGLSITPENFKDVFPWDQQFKLPSHVKFLGILYYWKSQYGNNAFNFIIEKYKLTELRDIPVLQGDTKTDKAIYVDSKDIDTIFAGEKITFTFDLALEVLVQLLYEELRGNGCIDELLYQNIDDVGIGLSGLQSDVEPTHLRGKNVKKAFEGAWVKFSGLNMHLSFMSFHSFENLKRVVQQLVRYDMQGSFSEKDGYKMGYGKDGSRRTSVITPFAENPAAWVRKFTAKDLTNKELITSRNTNNIGNWAWLMEVEKALVKGGATIPICGPQGAGKTTKLEGISEYIQNWFAIRMIESEFEARIRWRYPEKNILTVQTPVISPEKAYEFSLRTSGDIYIVSEVRSDEMMVNITRTANRGGRSVLFTYHPNKPRATVIEVANSLIRQKLYTSLKDAMYTTLEVIKCCIHITADIETKSRYYNIYEYIPTEIKLDTSFMELEGAEREESFLKTTLSYYQKRTGDEYFEVVPIITYDRDTNSYTFKNNISDRFFYELYNNSSINEERIAVEKLFRPIDWVKKHIAQTGKTIKSQVDLDILIEREQLNPEFISLKALQESGVS